MGAKSINTPELTELKEEKKDETYTAPRDLTGYRISSRNYPNGKVLSTDMAISELAEGLKLKLELKDSDIDGIKRLLLRIEENINILHSATRHELETAISMLDYCIDTKDEEEILKGKKFFITSIEGIITKFLDSPDFKKTSVWLRTLFKVDQYPEKIEGSTNVEGRISSITSLLAPNTFSLVGAILKEKINSNEPFRYDLFFEKQETIEKFITYCNSIGLTEPQIKANTYFIDGNGTRGIDNGWVWARDGAISGINPKNGKKLIIEPVSSFAETRGSGGNSAFDRASYVTGADVIQSRLLFQGGNIRQTKSTLFIGIEDILINLEKLSNKSLVVNLKERILSIQRSNPAEINQDDFKEIIKKFKEEFGKEIVVIGAEKKDNDWQISQTWQPYFHIDLFFTPLGEKDIAIVKLKETDPAYEWVQNMKKSLESNGYIIHEDIPGFENMYLGKITYNNVLIEDYVDSNGKRVKKVYVPQYGESERKSSLKILLDKSDQEAIVAWSKLGYEAIKTPVDVTNIINQGSLNCLTNESRS